jgi:putative chitinase
MDRRIFFKMIRISLFGRRMGLRQVQGISAILDAWDRHGEGGTAALAYVLATSHHETGRRMQPIRELGGRAYLTRLYDVTGARPALARRNGNFAPGDGVRYSGRGFVQLTWRDNYRRIGQLLDVDLEGQPDLALDPALSARILVEGMIKGWFTGRALGDYISDGTRDFRSARRVVNGLDRAAAIARIADLYLVALKTAQRLESESREIASTATNAPTPQPAQRGSMQPRRRSRAAVVSRPRVRKVASDTSVSKALPDRGY